MTRKQIDQYREMRLWIGQIIVPTATLVATVMSIPEVRESVSYKLQEIKHKIIRK